jgi:hypothetical protein
VFLVAALGQPAVARPGFTRLRTIRNDIAHANTGQSMTALVETQALEAFRFCFGEAYKIWPYKIEDCTVTLRN